MGQGHSSRKLRKSTSSDVLNNVVWSLDELIAWEDQCDLVRDLLRLEPPSQKTAGALPVSAGTFDFDDARRVLEEIDQLLSEHRQDKREGTRSHTSRESHDTDVRSTSFPSASTAGLGGISSTTGSGGMTPRQAAYGGTSTSGIGGGMGGGHGTIGHSTPSATPSSATSSMGIGAGTGTTGTGTSGGTTAPSTAATTTTASEPMSPIQAPASKLFAAVATDELSSGGLDHGTSAPDVRVVSAEQQGHGSQRLWQGGSSSGADDNSDSVERKHIAAKYLFIHSMLDRLLKSAQYTYKLKSKLDHAAKRIKSRRSDAMQELELMQRRREHEEIERALNLSLSNFDKTRSAVGWLLSDYELSYALYKCTREIVTIKQSRDRLQFKGGGGTGMGATGESSGTGVGGGGTTLSGGTGVGMPQSSNTDTQVAISSLDHLLYQFQARRHELELAMQQNERDSLTVGLNFLDVQQRGCIEPKEAPELSARLFSLLDLTHDGVISHDDLEKSILTISDKLEDLQAEIYRLEQENAAIRVQQPSNLGTLQMAQNQDRLVRLRQDVDEQKHTLKSIYRYFHVGFSKHVFNKVEGEVTEKKVDLHTLFDRLRLIDEEGHQDPLQLPGKEELHRQLQRASLGTGAIRELRGAHGSMETSEALDAQARAGLGIDRGAQEQVQRAVSEAQIGATMAGERQRAVTEQKYDEEQLRERQREEARTMEKEREAREQQREKMEREMAAERSRQLEKQQQQQVEQRQQQVEQQQQQQQVPSQASTSQVPQFAKVALTPSAVEYIKQAEAQQAGSQSPQAVGPIPMQIQTSIGQRDAPQQQYASHGPSQSAPQGQQQYTPQGQQQYAPQGQQQYVPQQQQQPQGQPEISRTESGWSYDDKGTASRSYAEPKVGRSGVLPESESRAGYESIVGEPRTTNARPSGGIGTIPEEDTGEDSMSTRSGFRSAPQATYGAVDTSSPFKEPTTTMPTAAATGSSATGGGLFEKLERMLPTSMQSHSTAERE